MEKPIIEVNQLSKKYWIGGIGAGSLRDELTGAWRKIRGQESAREAKSFMALNEVSFEIAQGEILGVIGRNGAGKSTLLKILSRITEPTSGQAVLRGSVASLLEVGTGFHPELSGRENIYLSGAILGMSKREIRNKFDAIVDFAEVEKFIDSPIKRYSSGMAVRLGFAVAAHLDSDILIVDEVLAVGDLNYQDKCLAKMNEICRSGRTILFVSHNPLSIEMLCHRCILLENGQLQYSGPPRDALQKYEATYLALKEKQSQEDASSTAQLRVTLHQSGEHCKTPTVHEPLTVRLKFTLPPGWPDIHPNIQLRTRAQQIVFSSISPEICTSPDGDATEGRSYIADCEIPANTLNTETYSIAIHLLTPNGVLKEYFDYACNFTPVEDARERPIHLTREWPGLLRPKLPWKVSVGE